MKLLAPLALPQRADFGIKGFLETSFLVDFERENNRGVPGPALAFLEAHGDARLYITLTVAGVITWQK